MDQGAWSRSGHGPAQGAQLVQEGSLLDDQQPRHWGDQEREQRREAGVKTGQGEEGIGAT